jgi:hypothetical protein
MENRNCQKCNQNFTITPDDISYYEKIGVVRPELCPLCRAQLRLNFRNERVFYKRTCDKCSKDTISMYSQNKPYPVWCYECWWADDWDPKGYAREYNENEPFFDQWEKLFHTVPKPSLVSTRAINCEYLNYAADNKDCYMIIECSNNENCIHCYWIQVSKDLVDCSYTQKVERSYESDDCYDSYALQYCKGCHSCTDSFFLLDCRGCSNCIGCINLRQQKYCIFNEQYTKEEYEEKIQSLRLDTYTGVEAFRAAFAEFIKDKPRKYAEIYHAVNSTGNYMNNVKNNYECFHSYDAEENKYCVHAWRGAKDCMDCNTVGRIAESIYNTLNTGVEVSNVIAGSVCWGSQFMEYCVNCPSSQHCFGCVGLRNHTYCIFNKQYTKEEYGVLREQIISKMKQEGIYGNFYPASISAFGYNETSAMIETPLSKDEALAQGFAWEDTPRGTYGKETKLPNEVPDSISEIDFDVSKEIFVCSICTKNYKIIPNEYLFYQKLSIPLPRLCPDCRHARRVEARGPNKLWHRVCMCEQNAHGHEAKCLNEFETSYNPDRTEIVFCEQCYQNQL